jgi:predicted site-specific integrase-resolvase
VEQQVRTEFEQMLTLRQVCLALNISEWTARRLLEKGTFPIRGVQVAGRWRFSPSVLRRFIEGPAYREGQA